MPETFHIYNVTIQARPTQHSQGDPEQLPLLSYYTLPVSSKFNASSCILDVLGDLRVESIDAEEGNFKLWIITDDYNWFSKPKKKTMRWIDARKECGDFMCSNCQFLCCTNQYNYCPDCGAKMESEGANNE